MSLSFSTRRKNVRKIAQQFIQSVKHVVAPVFTYRGRITFMKPSGIGHIGIETVVRSDGEPHAINTKEHIAVNKNKANGLELCEGMEILFCIEDDTVRGKNTYRAYDIMAFIPEEEPAVQESEEILKAQDTLLALTPIEGSPWRAPSHEALLPTPPKNQPQDFLRLLDGTVWTVPADTLANVASNDLLNGISRDIYRREDITKPDVLARTHEALSNILHQEFSLRLGRLDPSYDISSADTDFHKRVNADLAGMRGHDMDDQIRETTQIVVRYTKMRNFLKKLCAEGMVRPNSVLPIVYLPDILLAFPVWFFVFKERDEQEAQVHYHVTDPQPHSAIHYICSLLLPQQFKDLFQMFNMRARSAKIYQGDTVPAEVSGLMEKAQGFFDYIVIATPYHDFAGKDWGEFQGTSPMDPLVLGFNKELPSVFFLLERFSDSGLYPSYNELVAATIEFIKKYKELLGGVCGRIWIKKNGEEKNYQGSRLGVRLSHVADQIFTAFKLNKLSAWLRGEADVRPRQVSRHHLSS